MAVFTQAGDAVLSFKREGYRRTAFNARDFAAAVFCPGFWRLAVRHAGEGLKEMHRSFSKAALCATSNDSYRKFKRRICCRLLPGFAPRHCDQMAAR